MNDERGLNMNDERNAKDRAAYARKAGLRWRARYRKWLDSMREKYGAEWAPGPGVDTWRKWRNRRLAGGRSRMVRGPEGQIADAGTMARDVRGCTPSWGLYTILGGRIR
jgi:hypothetical protein